jgi:hypothetical protein
MTASLEFFFELLLHLFVVARDDAVKFVAIINVPFWLIMIFVVHHTEPGFVSTWFSLLLTFSCRFKSLEINRLKAFDFHLIDLRELAHLAAATTM